MNSTKTSLQNGVRIITSSIPTSESATITVWVRVGSRFENPKIAGISHFLEHIVFKGSKKYPTAKDIAETVDALGGEFNAATSKEWTNFYIKVRKDNLESAFDVLADMVLYPLLRPADIEREKGVIIEEIAMYDDTPMFKIGDVFENLIFANTNLEKDISGSKETVRQITQDDFKRYIKMHYVSNNIVISVAGGIDENKVIALAQRYFDRIPKQAKALEELGKTPKQAQPKVLLKSKENEQAHLIIGFLAGKRGNEKRFIEAVLASILGGGMSSRLFTEIREKRGLAYSVRTSIEKYIDTGDLSTYAGIKTDKIDEAVKVMLDQYYGLASGAYPVTPKELAKAKEFIKGHIALSLEDSREINNFYGENELMLGKVETLEEVYKGIDKVTVGDIVELARQTFIPEKLNLAIIGPYKNPSRFERLIK